MPTISIFYGICIMMYLRDKEHNPPHIHAFYGGQSASFLIASGEVLEGAFPKNAKKLVKEFITKYRDELFRMWETGIILRLKGID